jgi:hypothetical protein
MVEPRGELGEAVEHGRLLSLAVDREAANEDGEEQDLVLVQRLEILFGAIGLRQSEQVLEHGAFETQHCTSEKMRKDGNKELENRLL